ncbi:MAG: peptidyl-tRNA hydrolase Pth2 [archaeon]|jgi:PTH2 family peptidyl-tRNA hydrolase|nr:peptidyl-tRNA hydrolase Pth2 [archaeon]
MIIMNLKQAIVVRADLGMGKGKIAAQASHASVEVLEKADSKIIEEWKQQGMKKIVLKIGSKRELLELFQKMKKLFPAALIKDAGLTQITPGEPTCIAIGPAEEIELDKFLGDLKLL